MRGFEISKNSLGRYLVDIVRHIVNPDTWILRNQERARAKLTKPSVCPHPLSAIEQFVDEEPGRAGRPTNLYQCVACKSLLRLVDFWGQEAADG